MALHCICLVLIIVGCSTCFAIGKCKDLHLRLTNC